MSQRLAGALACACLIVSSAVLLSSGEGSDHAVEPGAQPTPPPSMPVEVRSVAYRPRPVAPSPFPTPRPVTGPDELEAKVRAAFPDDPDTAMRIVTCESNWDPTEVSPTGDYGLFQINRRTWEDEFEGEWGMGDWDENIFDVNTNIRVAQKLHAAAGWAPWVCY